MAEDLEGLWAKAAPAQNAKTEDLDALWERAAPHVDPLDGVSGPERFFRGAEYGLGNTAVSVAKLFGLGKVIPDAWGEAPETYKALHDNASGLHATVHVPLLSALTGDFTISPGSLGNVLGETVASAPAAMVGGGFATKALSLLGAAEPAAATGLARLAALGLTRSAEGATQGAVLAGPDHRLQGLTLGAMLGGPMGVGADLAGGAIRGLINPTADAAELLRRGVPLSTGQLDPHGPLNTIEEAGQHSAIGGKTINAARSASRRGWQDLALNEAGAPGFKVEPGTDIQDAFAQARASFADAYGPIRATPIPESIAGKKVSDVFRAAFDQATDDADTVADDASRSAVNKFLQNQVTKLKGVKTFAPDDGSASPGATPGVPVTGSSSTPLLMSSTDLGIHAPLSRWSEAPLSEATNLGKGPSAATGAAQPTRYMTADALISMRSAIRKQAEKYELGTSADATEKAALLRNGESLVTSALEKQLGPEASLFNHMTDARYARLNDLEAAQRLSKMGEEGFTPEQLGRVVALGATAADVASGLQGNTLGEIARLGRSVLENKGPLTGAKQFALPFGLNHIAGSLGALAQRPGVRSFLLGDLAAQGRARAMGDTLGSMLPNMLKRGDFTAGPNALLAPLAIQQR